MTPPPSSDPDPASVATTWVMRHDRGLSPAEQDEFLHWLSADPRHGEEMARHRRTWESFDRLAGLQTSAHALPDPDLLAPDVRARRRRAARRWAFLAAPLAAAAAMTVAVVYESRPSAAPAARETLPAVKLAPIEERRLEDGSTIRLNRGAKLHVTFSASERRVRLERGEADFDVAKDPARPFLVESGDVSVRAVGTAFNVRLADRAVEVIVTEGIVALTRGNTGILPELSAGDRAFIPRATAEAAVVDTPTREELDRRLAWQPRVLGFTDEPLAAIVNEFNRHNPVMLRIVDPGLRELRLTARFRSDNVPGFLRLLASDFGVRADPGADDEVVLRSAH